MTLDKDLPRGERARRRRQARKAELREYDEGLQDRKPWLFPLLLGAAVVVILAVVGYWIVTGAGA